RRPDQRRLLEAVGDRPESRPAPEQAARELLHRHDVPERRDARVRQALLRGRAPPLRERLPLLPAVGVAPVRAGVPERGGGRGSALGESGPPPQARRLSVRAVVASLILRDRGSRRASTRCGFFPLTGWSLPVSFDAWTHRSRRRSSSTAP